MNLLPSDTTPLPSPRRVRCDQQIKSISHFILFLVSVALTVTLQATDAFACTGWLCGVLQKINGTQGLSAGSVFFTMVFVAIQVIIAILIVFLLFMTIVSAQKESAWIWFLALLILVLLFLFSSNAVAGYVLGTSTAPAAGGGGAATSGLEFNGY